VSRAVTSIRVLLVDDDEEDYLLTKEMLSSLEGGVRHELDWIDDFDAALEASAEDDHDVWLVDYRLGSHDGIDLVRQPASDGRDIPVIVLTGDGRREIDVEAAEAGASDFLVKGELSQALLERTIRYSIQSRAQLRALRGSQERLRRTQRMEALGQLAGGVAHDFNNMMSAVIGFSQLGVGRLDDTERLAYYFREIQRAGERAAAMTRQLLAFSRKQVFRTRVLDLNTIVAEVEALLRRLITDDIELVTVLDPALVPVEADPGQLEQVLVNLAINAGDAMPRGGTLTIETSNVELEDGRTSTDPGLDAGSYALLAMTDTGTGMDAETARHIFEPFFTTKEVGRGTGLGLSTVFGIVAQSGGEIRVSSTPGAGTTFRVYLPRAGLPVDRAARELAPGTAAALAGARVFDLSHDGRVAELFDEVVGL
jgi:two-component system, cell cycle sensor histidine kinase and response regulator CckA